MKIKPLKNRVLVEFREESPEDNNLIHIPDSVYKSKNKAIVIAKGPDVDNSVNCGDVVLVRNTGGVDVDDSLSGEKKLKLYRDDELIAKF